MSVQTNRVAAASQMLLLSLIIALTACNKSESSTKTFASAEDAGNALLQAAKAGDQSAVLVIFGPKSKELIYSGDAVQDKAVTDAFLSAYAEMHRWRKTPDGSQILLVGADNFPLPIPLKKNARKWFFDTPAGKDEVLARRVGRNELAIIEACLAVVDAQAEYSSQSRDGDSAKQYAVSSSATQASKMACTGILQKASPRARSARW